MMWWTTLARGIECAKGVIVEQRITGGGRPHACNTIGVDLAKNAFQVHGVDSAGKVVITRQLRRKQVLEFLESFLVAWLVWRPAQPVIIGHGKSANSVTPFA
jgi:hypothetical protein